jgi:predicted lysophospholipase L1 biosynthesis ABC-type transport system permease subunit
LPDSQDWTVQLTDRLESTVAAVRDRTTVPVIRLAQIIVYGVVAGVFGAVLVFLFVLTVVRLLNSYLPIEPEARRVWVADAIASAIFLSSGLFLWRRRGPTPM